MLNFQTIIFLKIRCHLGLVNLVLVNFKNARYLLQKLDFAGRSHIADLEVNCLQFY